jgi:hypothetical protein
MTGMGHDSRIDEVGDMDREQNPMGESLRRADTIENIEGSESTDAIELEEATLDPEALIETQQVYAQAESIEAAVIELVDTSQDVSGESGNRIDAGEARDPSLLYRQRPIEELETAASQVIAHAFLDSDFRGRLVEHPDDVLGEHGLTRQDLPDLSDPEGPEAAAFIRQVHNRLFEGVDENRRSETQHNMGTDDPGDQERMLALQMAMDHKDQSEKSSSSVLTAFQNAMRDLVANLK